MYVYIYIYIYVYIYIYIYIFIHTYNDCSPFMVSRNSVWGLHGLNNLLELAASQKLGLGKGGVS